MNYRLTIDSQTVVKENDDGTLVCFDPTDTTEKYQNEYQQWLDDGNLLKQRQMFESNEISTNK